MKAASFRIAMYSHDTYGLGHLTRTLRLARATVEELPGASVLILTGSPVAHRFEFPPRVDYVKLPSVVKSAPETYEPRDLRISSRAVRAIRATIIRNTLALFRPHLFLVDNAPVGMKGELLSALLNLKDADPAARICLNLRDVLDTPSEILRSWTESGAVRVLRHLYDAIHVFGSPEVYDAVAAYHLPVDKSFCLGYVPPFPDEQEPGGISLPPAEPGRSRILVTTGGGGDGQEIVRCVLELQRSLGVRSPYLFHVITGPFMNAESREMVARSSKEIEGLTLHEHVDHLPSWMAACDLVLSMGGYNTLCEVMASARRSVVVPRIHPRREQEIRAHALERRGLLKVLDPRALDARSLNGTLRLVLDEVPCIPAACRPPLTGTARFQEMLRGYLCPADAPLLLQEGRRRTGREEAAMWKSPQR